MYLNTPLYTFIDFKRKSTQGGKLQLFVQIQQDVSSILVNIAFIDLLPICCLLPIMYIGTGGTTVGGQ